MNYVVIMKKIYRLKSFSKNLNAMDTIKFSVISFNVVAQIC